MLQEMWKKYTDEDRKPYELKSQETKKKYDEQIESLGINFRQKGLPAGAPKRPLTSYFIFLRECRLRLKASAESPLNLI